MLSYSFVPSLRIATDLDGIAALKQLVDVLTHVDHPSVIRIESTRFEAHRAEVLLTTVEGVPLTSPELSLEQLTKAVASTSAAIAHVHERSVALGTINADSFVVRTDASAVLHGFDDAIMNATKAQQRDDIQKLAAFARSCIPEVDTLRDRINGSPATPLRESLVRILEQAENGSLDARQLAEKLRHALWFDNATSLRHQEARQKKFSWPLGRHVTASALTVIAALGIVTGTRIQSNAASSPPPPPDAPSCQLRTGTTVDTDLDGCPDTVAVSDGVVTINTDRYAIGVPGDEIVLGNWQCNAQTTLALLRPSTGELFIFDEWPKPGSTSRPRTLTVPAPSSDLHAQRVDECDALAVTTAHGPQQLDARKATP